jgi:hypothetical protein
MTVAEIKKKEVIDMGILYSQILTKIEKFETDEQKIEYATEFSDAVEMYIFKRELRRSQHDYNQQQLDALNIREKGS